MASSRKEIWGSVLWDSMWKKFTYPILVVLGTAQALRDEFIEEPTRTEWTVPKMIPTLEDYLPSWPWWSWFVILAVVILVILVEGTYRKYKKTQIQLGEHNRLREPSEPARPNIIGIEIGPIGNQTKAIISDNKVNIGINDPPDKENGDG